MLLIARPGFIILPLTMGAYSPIQNVCNHSYTVMVASCSGEIMNIHAEIMLSREHTDMLL